MRQAGVDVCFGVDHCADAAASYETNLQSLCLQLDLSKPHGFDTVVKRLGAAPSLVFGGPPCQGFTSAGMQRNDDPRNRLILSYLDFISALRPRWFLFENVEGLLTANRGEDVSALVTLLVKAGYVVSLAKINFAGYGLPQSRKRVVIIGNNVGAPMEFPCETHSYDSGKVKSSLGLMAGPTVDDAIGDLPAPSEECGQLPYGSSSKVSAYAKKLKAGSSRITHHQRKAGPRQMEAVRHLGPGQSMKDLPERLQHPSFKARANRRVSDGYASERRGGAPSGLIRLNGNMASRTITSASSREFIHPSQDRPLTSRECARLQSFPDGFQFSGSGQSVQRQIGNAIPPLGARMLGTMVAVMDGRYGSDTRTDPPIPPGLISYSVTQSKGMSPALKRTVMKLDRLRPPARQC